MIRWVILGVLVIGLTSICTVAVQMMPSATTDHPSYPTGSKSEKTGPQPKVVVDGETTYNFGTKSQQTVGEKSWTVRNEGEGDLIIRKGPPACSCTVAKLGPLDVSNDPEFKITLKPAEHLDVLFRFETRLNKDHYHKEISLLTNDSAREEVRFIFEGDVQPPFSTYPPGSAINFLSVSNEADQVARISLISASKPDFAVQEVVSSRPEDLTATIEPLTDEERKFLKAENGGYMIHVKLRKGMGLGAFREELVLKTDNPMKPEFPVSVTGVMTGPITTIPAEVGIFNVNGSKGGSANLTLIVRGQKETRFTVGDHPEKLNVTIEPADLQGEGGSKYQLSVVVPPGTAAGVIKGTITLKTDHPMASELKVPVSIVVRNAS